MAYRDNLLEAFLVAGGASQTGAVTRLPSTKCTFQAVANGSSGAFAATVTIGVSNDGTNFATLSISSVTYSAAGTTVWDFGVYNYKYIVLNFLKPTNGAISVLIKLFGTRE